VVIQCVRGKAWTWYEFASVGGIVDAPIGVHPSYLILCTPPTLAHLFQSTSVLPTWCHPMEFEISVRVRVRVRIRPNLVPSE